MKEPIKIRAKHWMQDALVFTMLALVAVLGLVVSVGLPIVAFFAGVKYLWS